MAKLKIAFDVDDTLLVPSIAYGVYNGRQRRGRWNGEENLDVAIKGDTTV